MVNKIRNGLVFVRTPKCASTTVANHLKEFCDWKGMKYTSQTEHGVMAPKNYCNLGHLYSGDVNWDTIKREDRGVIGVIRNPLDRFISHVNHNIRINLLPPSVKEMGISKFYLENYHNTHFENAFRGMDNYMVKYLGIGDDLKWSSDLLLSKYDFMFVSENIEVGLHKFEKLTGYRFKDSDLYMNKSNKNKNNITDEFLDMFKKRNKHDYELYETVLNKYEYKELY